MWLVGTTCFSPPSPVSRATKPGHAAFLPMTGWHLVVLHQTLTAGNERGRCAQCGTGGHGVHPRNAECFHPGCSWGDGGTSAAHVWAVLSGRCCKAGHEEPEPGLWAALGQVLGCLDSLGSRSSASSSLHRRSDMQQEHPVPVSL